MTDIVGVFGGWLGGLRKIIQGHARNWRSFPLPGGHTTS